MHNKLNYKDSGVDIEQSNKLVASIKPMAKRTHRAGVLNGIGGFGALFEVPVDRYQQPILVSGTDGVGTKLMLAVTMNRHDSIGIDLVAMCVNDLISPANRSVAPPSPQFTTMAETVSRPGSLTVRSIW